MKPNEFINKLKEAEFYALKLYWETITPTTDMDCFRRWLFALMSVHTGWQSNVNGYNKIRDLDWNEDFDLLSRRVLESKVGLHKNRTRAIWDLWVKFKVNPDYYYKNDNESWVQYRNRLADDTFGLGLAKTSFAIFLCNPVQSEIICLDVHLLRFMGWNKDRAPSKKEYEAMESKWIQLCKNRGYSPGICREIYWNNIQKQKDSRYWSYCLEKKYEVKEFN